MSDVIGSVVTVSWNQTVDHDVAVEYTFGDTTLVTPTQAAVAGQNDARLLGVPYGTEVTFEVQLGDRVSLPQTIATELLPANLSDAERLIADDDHWDPDLAYVLASVTEVDADWSGPWWTIIFDRLGRIVWARKTPEDMVTIYPQVSADGALLIDENSFWVTLDQGVGSSMRRLRLDGSAEDVFSLSGLHHGFVEDGSGAIVWPSFGADEDTLERLSKAGVRDTLWDCASIRESTGTSDLCSANTITWQPDVDAFLVSFWSLDTVVEIDARTGATRDWFGQLDGAWTFSPAEAGLWWPHGATYTDAGTLIAVTRSQESGEDNENHRPRVRARPGQPGLEPRLDRR